MIQKVLFFFGCCSQAKGVNDVFLAECAQAKIYFLLFFDVCFDSDLCYCLFTMNYCFFL